MVGFINLLFKVYALFIVSCVYSKTEVLPGVCGGAVKIPCTLWIGQNFFKNHKHVSSIF